MGCDIHLHQEVKIKGKWYHYRDRSIIRNYELFALMADVRNNDKITPVSFSKGFPENITFLTKYDYEENCNDYHSESWLNAKEISEVIKRFFKNTYDAEDYFGYLFGNSWLGFLNYPSDIPNGLEDIRWVFWFDN